VVNELTQSIARAIRKEYQTQHIYTEQIPQCLKKPCFFIHCISNAEQNAIDLRFLAQHTFVISYFPLKGNAECWEVQQKLHRLLELIALQDSSLIRGTHRRAEMRDGVLHFFVDYDFYMYKQKQPEEYMRGLKVYGKTREIEKGLQ